MSSCCRSGPCEEMFGAKAAERDLEEYLRHGLGDLERRIVADLRAVLGAAAHGAAPGSPRAASHGQPKTAMASASGATTSPTEADPVLAGTRVLEIGGGVGAIQADLLRSGAATGEVIELVPAYRRFAQRLAEAWGTAGRTAWRVHDLLADPQAVAPADLVIMNRVVCCSAEGVELAAAAARLTRRALALSYPRSTRFTRFAAAAQRTVYRWLGRTYRAFAWPEEVLASAVCREGLRVAAEGGGSVWRYMVLVRAG